MRHVEAEFLQSAAAKVRRVFVLVTCFAALGSVASPQALPQGDTLYIEGASLFAIKVQLPADYDPGATYPLVVGLHGHGGRYDEFFIPAPLFRAAGVIYAVPQAPYGYLTSGRVGYSWNLRDVDDEAEGQGDDVTIRYVLDVVDKVRRQYSVDEVYLMGFSQGGHFTYRTAIPHHDVFAGLAAFGSRFDADWFAAGELAAASGLRVFAAGGRDDPIAETSEVRDALEPLGYEVDVYDFDGGHIIDRSAIEKLLEWINR